MNNINTVGISSSDPIQDSTISALEGLLGPLLDLIMDAGVTVQEFNQVARRCAVNTAMKKVVQDTGRQSISRVAIVTGLPRGEVSKILATTDIIKAKKSSQQPARRILSAWFDDPLFATAAGEPAILPIFGKKSSFERLVRKYGGGCPVRAMLDELIQLNAVAQLSEQRVKVKSRVPISTGLTHGSITAMGDRTKDLLETLAHNLRGRKEPLFEATALLEDSNIEMVSFLRREIAEQGSSFISSATSLLNRSRKRRARSPAKASTQCRLGVTVYYFQDEVPSKTATIAAGALNRRKNLRRRQPKLGNNGSE